MVGHTSSDGVKCGSYPIITPFASACWYGYNQRANHKDNSQHLPLMVKGSTCAATDPTCIINPYNAQLSWVDPNSYSTVCDVYIKNTSDTAHKGFAAKLAKACLAGYDTEVDKDCWCSVNENISAYMN